MTPRPPLESEVGTAAGLVPNHPVGAHVVSVRILELRGGVFKASTVASPMDFAPRFRHRRSAWYHLMEPVVVVIEASDGTRGIGRTAGGAASRAVVAALARLVLGEDVGRIDHLWELCRRATLPYGSDGLAAMARSAIDLALWDLAGNQREMPVARLLGQVVRPDVPVYVSTPDVAAAVEQGSTAVKIPLPEGPWDGPGSIARNLTVIDRARQLVPDSLMADAWMGWDLDYTMTIAPELRDRRLDWLEEPVPPSGHGCDGLRDVLAPTPVAAGEHVQDVERLVALAAEVDVLQPDLEWCGGLTAVIRVVEQLGTVGRRPVIAPHVGAHIWAVQLAAAGLVDGPLEWYLDAEGPQRLDEAMGWDVRPRDGRISTPEGSGFGMRFDIDRISSRAMHAETISS